MPISFLFDGVKEHSLISDFFTEETLQKQKEKFQQTVEDKSIGFFDLPHKNNDAKVCLQVYEKFKEKKVFVQVGIGGSSLGPEMLISALQKSQTDFHFINNIDPDQIAKTLEKIEPAKSLFYFVSKSGGTAETMASLSIITTWLKGKGIEQSELKNYFVFATDPLKSDLLELGQEWEISTLPIPSNVGGRYSVLTSVGLFPALFAGINIQELLKGASLMREDILSSKALNSPLFQMAATLNSLLKEKSINQTVLMPYSSLLKNFSHWFVQLWAESLGKKQDLDLKEVFQGLTPIASYGATDQHSQMQLFMEGPKDKCLILISVSEFQNDYDLAIKSDITSLKKLAPYSLSELMSAELSGTKKALQEQERPFLELCLPKLDENALGAMILFFESLTALMGNILNIDPFDQPGVEAGKRYAFEWLNKSSS